MSQIRTGAAAASSRAGGQGSYQTGPVGGGFVATYEQPDRIGFAQRSASVLVVGIEDAAGAAALDGVAAGTSTAAAIALTLDHVLTGASAGTSTAAATRITEPQALAGASAGTSTVAATRLVLNHVLAGSSAGTSTAGATGLRQTQPLAASSTGTSTAAASGLSLTSALAASSAGTSTAAATSLRQTQPLAASAAGTSTAAAAFSTGAGAALAGLISGTSTAAALRLTLEHVLTASMGGTSTASAAAIALPHAFAGSTAGTSTAVSDLTNPAAGSIVGAMTGLPSPIPARIGRGRPRASIFQPSGQRVLLIASDIRRIVIPENLRTVTSGGGGGSSPLSMTTGPALLAALESGTTYRATGIPSPIPARIGRGRAQSSIFEPSGQRVLVVASDVRHIIVGENPRVMRV